MSSLAVKAPWKLKLPGRLKGGRLEKWGELLSDLPNTQAPLPIKMTILEK